MADRETNERIALDLLIYVQGKVNDQNPQKADDILAMYGKCFDAVAGAWRNYNERNPVVHKPLNG